MTVLLRGCSKVVFALKNYLTLVPRFLSLAAPLRMAGVGQELPRDQRTSVEITGMQQEILKPK
jgi:hypothetical protein